MHAAMPLKIGAQPSLPPPGFFLSMNPILIAQSCAGTSWALRVAKVVMPPLLSRFPLYLCLVRVALRARARAHICVCVCVYVLCVCGVCVCVRRHTARTHVHLRTSVCALALSRARTHNAVHSLGAGVMLVLEVCGLINEDIRRW